MAILIDEYGPVKTSKIGNLNPQCPFFTMAEQDLIRKNRKAYKDAWAYPAREILKNRGVK